MKAQVAPKWYAYDISVMIPFYKEEREVFRKSLESVYAQSILDDTTKKVQIILVCDDPTDENGLYEIAEELKQKNEWRVDTVLIKNNVNLGRGYTRNKILEIIEWEFSAVHDADDIDHPMRLEKELEHMRAHGDVDLLFANMQIVNVQGQTLRRFAEVMNIDAPSFFKRQLNHPTMFAKSEVLKKLKYGFQNRWQDFDLWVRAFVEWYKFDAIDEELVEYLSLEQSPQEYILKIKAWCKSDMMIFRRHFWDFYKDKWFYRRILQTLYWYTSSLWGEKWYNAFIVIKDIIKVIFPSFFPGKKTKKDGR